MMSFHPDFHTLSSYYEMGGFVMLPLILVSVLLWYALAVRWIAVRTARKDARKLIKSASKNKLSGKSVAARAARLAVEKSRTLTSRKELKSHLNEAFSQLMREVNQYRMLVRSLVAIAPLLGLLGTVDGMIETFDSLGDMALFSQTGGVAGGISRALFTTQMGLAISIPGLLLGRILERKQSRIAIKLDQIRDLVSAEMAP